MKRVTGIGGIFFKCKDPEKVKQWYNTHLGFDAGAYGARFEWREEEDSTKKGSTIWSPFPDSTNYFEPGLCDRFRYEIQKNTESASYGCKA